MRYSISDKIETTRWGYRRVKVLQRVLKDVVVGGVTLTTQGNFLLIDDDVKFDSPEIIKFFEMFDETKNRLFPKKYITIM